MFNKAKSGAERESIGTKIDTSLVPYELVMAAAVGLNYGAEKYSERNFEKGLPASILLGSIERHCKALMDSDHIDKDSGIPHFCLLASSVAMLCHNVLQAVMEDDRPVPKKGKPISELSKYCQSISELAIKKPILKGDYEPEVKDV